MDKTVHELLIEEKALWSEFWRRGIHRAKRDIALYIYRTGGFQQWKHVFSLRLMVAFFVAMMAFAPATLLAGGAEKKADSATSEQGKKDSQSSDKKDKEDAGAKKGAN